MSDILAINCDGLSSPSLKFKLPEKGPSSHPLGWGFGWYPHDQQGAIVAKDPVARNTQVLVDALTDWGNFRSTVFFCKIKGAAAGYSHHETQPFSRSFAGKDWLFIHNGDLDKAELEKLHEDASSFLEPLGKTDSELAFCYLLGLIQATGARNLSDVPPETLLGWFQHLDTLGEADMLLTDGTTSIVFQGTHSPHVMHHARFLPTPAPLTLDSEAAQVKLSDPRDTYRTAFIVTSSPFTTGDWAQMHPGELLIIRNGAKVWSSIHPDTKPANKPVHTSAPSPTLDTQMAFYAEHPTDGVHTILNTKSITRGPNGEALGYRLFDITHSTEYEYSEPVAHSTHVFRLHPSEDHVQELVQATLKISSEGQMMQYEDVFGNQSIHYLINKPYSSLKIEAKSRVKIYAQPADDHTLTLRQSSIPLVWMPWQRQMMLSYLLPPELPETQLHELTDYAMSFVKRNDGRLIDTLNDMNTRIYRDFEYVPGYTSLHTTPFEVYTSRKGVCQDFANLFICLAQLLSVPARYRMGYIHTGADYKNKIQSEASHAWAEVYLPYIGWRGFDPTNGCVVGQDHVRVACGRNYRDATPTSGTLFAGGGKETLRVEVKIEEVPPLL